jgi:hypothetical protein
MRRSDPKNHRPIPGQKPCGGGEAHRQPVLGPLVDLVKDLKRIGSHDPPSSGTDQSITIWWDNDNIYIESHLHLLAKFDIDINVFDGKFLIRLGR